ncbi:glycoside hydrolase family protein [Cupriavidus taiwanensis]|uniref:glycoside hydrolase family protein n=1 Tax=Cupriavidus taiwanensis TaxID=164546 RepID=UPI000E105521|nr:glycoside hydrolase family protein [Cupriavidus taiwanensis]SPA50609.1 protein of unknown function [Cupriavidus taiwanensis]
MLPADVLPENVMSNAMQQVAQERFQSGELRTPPPPKTLWDPQKFFDYLGGAKAITQPFRGAKAPQGGWLDMVKQGVAGSEGFESRAYHGVFSPKRRPGDIYVRPGDYVDGQKDEVSIGYGWNIPGNPDSEKVFKEVLGIDADGFKAIKSGTGTITQGQADKLLEYGIYRANGYVDHMVKRDLKDHERAALVSLMYNLGPGGFKARGIAEAINSGASPEKVGEMIRNSSPSAKKLQPRRAAEANLWLGVAGASKSLASTESNGLR